MMESKYKIGDKVRIQNWGSLTDELTIIDIKKIVNQRIGTLCWGYKLNWALWNNTKYVPEGQLRDGKSIKRDKIIDKLLK